MNPYCLPPFALSILLAMAVGWPGAARAGFLPLPNPGFELDADNNGYPDGWIVGFGPVLDKSGSEARTGQAAVKINANARIVTDVFPPPLSALTLRGWMRADPAAGHRGVLQFHQYNGSQFIELTSREHDLTTSWSLYGVNMRPLPGGSRVLPFFRSNSGQTWVWFDDMDVLTDRIDNGALEDISGGAPAAWTPVGMPTLDAVGGVSPESPTAVVCSRNHYYFQPIACSPTTRTYTLEFQVRAAAPADDSVLIKWFDGRGNYFSKTEIPFEAGTEYARVVHHFTAPALAVWGEAALQPVEDTWFWFDEIHLGWQNVVNPVFTPNGDGINDVATLHYTLPYDAATTVSLLDAQDGVVGILAASTQLPSGTHSAPIEGPIVSFLDEGTYRFRLDIGRPGTAPYAMEWPVQLRQILAWVEQPHASAGALFPMGIWEYVFGVEFAALSSFADLIERAAEWDFNATLMLFLKESDFDAAYDAARDSPIQAITHNYFINDLIDERGWPKGFDEFATRDLLLDYTARFGDNPNWFGIYLKDEPLHRDASAVRAAFRIAENVAPGQLPLSTFMVNNETAFLAEQVRPPVLMFDYYPVGVGSALGPGEWAAFVPALEQMRGVAKSVERPWWLVAQGFFNSAGRRPLLPAEQRGIVGLAAAHGAKGILYFIRSTFGGNEGVLDDQFQPSAMLAEVRAQNARLAGLGSYLLTLEPAEAEVTADDDQLLIEAFEDDEQRLAVIVVNMNTLIPRTGALTVAGAGPGTAAMELRGRPDGAWAVPLDVRVGVDEVTIALPSLAPGDWMLVRVE